MAQTILLKRSALHGKVPDTGSLQLGEIAMNTYDGKLFLKRSGSVESIQTIITTGAEITGSFNLLGDQSITGSLTVTNGITGSLFGTASYAITASHAPNSVSASYAATSSFASDFTIANVLTVQTINVQTITSSTEYVTGSTIFGSDLSNTHQFTGSVTVTGSLAVNGVDYITTSASVDSRILANSSSIGILSSSYLNSSASFDTRILNNSSSIGILSSSFLDASSSFDIRVLNNSSSIGILSSSYLLSSASFDSRSLANSASIDFISGAFVISSASFDTRILNNSSSIGVLSSSFLNASASFDTRILDNSSSIGILSSSFLSTSASLSASISLLSGSYLNSSASFDTRILDNSSSIGILSSSYLNSSASFDSRSLANSASIDSLSGSFVVASSSFDSRILNNSSSIGILSSSFLNASSSFDSRILSNSSSIGILSSSFLDTSASLSASISLLSGSYLNSSASFDTRILNNSSSIGILSSSYLFTSTSINSRVSTIESHYATTGSNTFKGDQIVTGSLNITGSTTQIGNNTLLGNTSLSGSIVMSGSQNPATPTIQIFGDTQFTGVTRYNPISRSIDNSISASYIYVSGSTNDLYFTQNGEGYSNTTRLRWLEGNLYTGLLNGGLLSTVTGSTTFNLSSGSGIIVNLNASLSENPYPTVQYVNWGNFTNQPLTYLTSSIQTFLGIDSNGQIIQQTSPWNDGQYNTSISIGTVLHQNQATTNGSISYPNVAYGWKQRSYDFVKAFGPLKLSGYNLLPSGSSTGSLVVSSGTAWADGRNYQTDPNNPSYITDQGTNVSKIFRYYQSGSGFVQDTNNGLGYLGIDPGNYNPNGSGSLTPVSPSTPWTNQRVFYYPNSVTKAIVVYYGTAQYASETEAINNLPYEQFVETPNTQQNAIYLGAITIKYNGSLQNPNDGKILPGGIFRNVGGSGGGGSVVTSTLAGLSDVQLSGPTNYQPLVYNTTLAKWINASAISGSLYGNAQTATSASYAALATTSSYALNATSSSYANIATSASYAFNSTSGSYAFNATSASYAISASHAPNSLTASYAVSASQATTASYANVATSASYAATSSFANDFTVAGTLTAQTINVQTITSSIDYVTGSTIFGSQLSNTHQFTGSVTVTGSLAVNGSEVILTNQTSSMTVLSSSYALTASYALNVPVTASYAISASQAENANNAITSSYALTSSNNILGGTNTFIPYWNNDKLVASSIAYDGFNTYNVGLTVPRNYYNFVIYAFTEPRIFLSSSNNDALTVYNSFGDVGLNYQTDFATNNIIRYQGYGGLNKLTIQTSETDRLTINSSGSIQFNAYTNNGLLKTINSNGTIAYATASVDYVIPSTLNDYVLNSVTSSMTVLSASYATTASYFVTSSVTSASYAENATSASYAITAVTSSYPVAAYNNIIYTPLGGVSPSTFDNNSSRTTLILGYQAALNTTNSFDGRESIYIGAYAGANSTGNRSATFVGEGAGMNSIGNNFSTVVGAYAGSDSTNSNEGSTVIGIYAGDFNIDSSYSTIIGNTAGNYVKASERLTLIGDSSGGSLTSSSYAIAIGQGVANTLSNSPGVTLVGNYAGEYAQSGSYSIVIGNSSGRLRDAGYKNLGRNNIIIGTNIALPSGRNDSINIGGILFGSGSAYQNMNSNGQGYSGFGSSFTGSLGNGKIGINVVNPQYNLDVSGSGNFTNGLTITGSVIANSFTGSLQGTSSYAINATSASQANNAISSSYALTASYASNVPVTASYAISASQATNANSAISSSYANNSTSASFALTASYASNVPVTSSYAISSSQATTSSFAITASYALNANAVGAGASVLHTQSTASSTWSFVHNLGSTYVTTDVYDSGGNIIIPQNISASLNTLTVTFSSPRTGYIVATVGGGLPTISSSYAGYYLRVNSTSNAAEWTEVVSSSFSPSASYANNADSSSYALNATNAATSSFATNFTVSNTFTFDATLNDYATVNSSIVGTNNLFAQITGSYTSAFFKYTVKNGTNARTGEVMAVWNGSNVEFTDVSTRDLGNTSAVTMSVALAGTDVQFNAITNTSGWSVKSLATFM